MKKRFGFTLAEVLITLGIIGVVAAMTVPTLIQNTNSAKFSAQFKKSVSTLSQAALMGQAQHDTDFALAKSCASDTKVTDYGKQALSGSSADVGNGSLTFCALFNSTLAGKTYLGTGGEVKLPNGSKYAWNGTQYALKGDNVLTNMLVYSLADGSLFGFNKGASECTANAGVVINGELLGKKTDAGGLSNCIGFIDTNGTTMPNTEVHCATAASTKLDTTTTCEINTNGLGDVYPIVLHDGIVEPASNAAKAVFTKGK